MFKFKLIALSALMFSQFTFAIAADQVVSVRSFAAAVAGNNLIRMYLAGRAPASEDVLVEMLRFVEKLDFRQSSVSMKATEMLAVAEEVGSQVPHLSPEVREELRPILNSLLAMHFKKTKNEIIMRIMNRFWFWTPEHLDFMARKVRNDSPQMIATQLMWILERATAMERQRFFSQIPIRKINIYIRWFPQALAFKYGRGGDERELKRLLNIANPLNLRPKPGAMNVDGKALPTTETLYRETRARITTEAAIDDCEEFLMLANSPRIAPGPPN